MKAIRAYGRRPRGTAASDWEVLCEHPGVLLVSASTPDLRYRFLAFFPCRSLPRR